MTNFGSDLKINIFYFKFIYELFFIKTLYFLFKTLISFSFIFIFSYKYQKQVRVRAEPGFQYFSPRAGPGLKI